MWVYVGGNAHAVYSQPRCIMPDEENGTPPAHETAADSGRAGERDSDAGQQQQHEQHEQQQQQQQQPPPQDTLEKPPPPAPAPKKKLFTSLNVNQKFLSKTTTPAPTPGPQKQQTGKPVCLKLFLLIIICRTPSFPCTRSLYIKTAVHQTAHDAYIKTIGITQSAAVIYTFISMGQTRSARSLFRVQHPPPARTHTAGNKRQHTDKHSCASGGDELGYWYCREKRMENGRIRIEIGHDDRVPDGQGSCRRYVPHLSRGRARDNDTAKTIFDTGQKAAAQAAALAAQVQAAHNQAIIQELDTFTRLEPHSHRWDVSPISSLYTRLFPRFRANVEIYRRKMKKMT